LGQAEDEYADIPDDDEQAFAHVEKAFRTKLYDALDASDTGGIATAAYREYINKTVAAAKALNLPILQEFPIPHENGAWEAYQNFSSEVDHYLVQINIRNARRIRGYSVAFDPVTKEKIRHYLSQIKTIVDRLEKISDHKREALYAKINALAGEVDRDRTKYEAYAALAIEISNTTGTVARKLKPAGGFLDHIAKLFGSAKETEETKALPAPQKRLEPPRRQLAPPADESRHPRGDLDDEIPF
jgi:hypothetical protein